MVAAAIVGGAAISAVGSSVAANQQSKGQQGAANTQLRMFNTINQQEQPFIQAGYGSTDTLSQLLGLTGNAGSQVGNSGLMNGYLTQTFSPEQFLNSPQYKFQQEQGSQALSNALTPTQGALSGATLKGLLNYNQGLASTYYNDYANQFQNQQNNIFSRLSGLSSLGQNAASNVGNSGTQLGTGIAQAQAGAAASQAAGTSNAFGTLGNALPALAMFGGGSSGLIG